MQSDGSGPRGPEVPAEDGGPAPDRIARPDATARVAHWIKRVPRGAVALWAMVLVMLLFLPLTYFTVQRLESIGVKRDQAVSLLRARRDLVLEMVRAAERAPEDPLSERTHDLLISLVDRVNALGESEAGQREVMDQVRIAIAGASERARAPILGAVQPALDALYVRDQEIVDAYRLQFARAGIRGPYLLLAVEALVTAGLVVAGFMVMREFRRRDATETQLRRSRERQASSERLARLGHWELDLSSGRVVMSDTMHEIVGVPRRFFGGTLEDLLSIVHAEDRRRVREAMADVSARPRTVFDQFRIMVEGQARVFFQRAEPMRDEEGRIVGLFAAAQDVTDQMRAEHAIREGEARFRALCDFSPLVVFVSRADGGMTHLSERWQALTGVSPKKALGWEWTSSIAAEDREAVVSSWREAVERAEPWTREFRVKGADGSMRWLRVLASPIGRDGAEPTGYVGTAEDVTDRIESARAIEASNERFRAIISASRQLVYDWNIQTNEISVDGRVEEIAGISAERLRTLGGWSESVHPDDRGAFDAEIARVLRTGEPFSLEYRLRSGNGAYIRVQDRGHFVRSENGQRHMIGLVADLGDSKAGGAARPGRERSGT